MIMVNCLDTISCGKFQAFISRFIRILAPLRRIFVSSSIRSAFLIHSTSMSTSPLLSSPLPSSSPLSPYLSTSPVHPHSPSKPPFYSKPTTNRQLGHSPNQLHPNYPQANRAHPPHHRPVLQPHPLLRPLQRLRRLQGACRQPIPSQRADRVNRGGRRRWKYKSTTKRKRKPTLGSRS